MGLFLQFRKSNKKVFVLNLKQAKIEKNNKYLPETVEFYNKNKFGVDIANQIAKNYNVKSRKWPFRVFCNILDLASINA
ncbi:LOW QUALITY PROTEIN: piggyBac transposable element-derived protein 4-like [Vespula squamosa]|uniref:PiggyBac transposable element-derived protein 4-like n=1 Tax=Vespula squamosa TaxID=30214 RepID=A0ABD2C508_VESSQ